MLRTEWLHRLVFVHGHYTFPSWLMSPWDDKLCCSFNARVVNALDVCPYADSLLIYSSSLVVSIPLWLFETQCGWNRRQEEPNCLMQGWKSKSLWCDSQRNTAEQQIGRTIPYKRQSIGKSIFWIAWPSRNSNAKEMKAIHGPWMRTSSRQSPSKVLDCPSIKLVSGKRNLCLKVTITQIESLSSLVIINNPAEGFINAFASRTQQIRVRRWHTSSRQR